MPPVSMFRVCTFRELRVAPAPGAPPAEAAVAATGADPSRAATVEVEDGKGPVIVIAIGERHLDWTGNLEEPFDPSRLVVRTWELEETTEEIGAADAPGLLLGEFRDALWENDVDGVRLLVAEIDDPDRGPIIVATSWYDSADFANDEDEDDGAL
jgi:hypothetical protein